MNSQPDMSVDTKEYTRGQQIFQRFGSAFSRIFSTELNPLYNLGSLAVLLFIIACISGIYIFIFYNINPRHAWDSVEKMSNHIFNGWMRSIHRYSSDLLVVFILLHMIHTIITSKFKRLVSWISGVFSFLIVVLIGVSGFMLVWDQKAKLTGYLTARLFSALPIFDPSIAGAFLMNDLTAVGGFFKVALFGHIVFSLITVIVIWVHVLRISKPKIFPPKRLIIYASIALGLVALVFPIHSDPPAQASNLPVNTTFDWYYYFGYYLMKVFTIGQNWMILVGSGILLSVLPFVIKRKNRPPVFIDLDKCDGCNLCSYDCPYEAIDMLMVNDNRKAILSPDKCVGCGICIGSCDEHAISHPMFPALKLDVEQKVDLTVFSCSYFPEPDMPDHLKIRHLRVPCIGSVMPKDVQEMLENNSHKVALLSCEDCYYRLGKKWTFHRFLRKRAPLFSKKYNASKVKLFTINTYNKVKLTAFSTENEDNNKGPGELHADDYQRHSPVISTLILIAFFALLIPLSSTVVHFFNPEEKMLFVNFKYISSPMAYEQNKSAARHMQSLTPVVKKRSPVLLRIYSGENNALIFQKEYVPRGVRQDIAMFIYEELKLTDDFVSVELHETAFPDISYKLEHIKLKKGDGTFVILKDGNLALASTQGEN